MNNSAAATTHQEDQDNISLDYVLENERFEYCLTEGNNAWVDSAHGATHPLTLVRNTWEVAQYVSGKRFEAGLMALIKMAREA